MNPVEVKVLACSSCGRMYADAPLAEKCCVCSECGHVLGRPGFGMCLACKTKLLEDIEEQRIAKARRVSLDEYDGDGVYIDGNFYWDYSPELLRDAWEADNDESWPGIHALTVWGVYSEPLELRPEELADCLYDRAYEDYEVDEGMYADLERLCAEWNAKHADKVYYQDNVIVVFGGL